MSELGFVKLHRKILSNAISKNLEFLGLFSALLLKANHKENDFFIGYEKVNVKPGQFVSSVRKLAVEFKLSPNKIYRMLEALKIEHIIEHEGRAKYSLFTIVNRHRYQVDRTQDRTQMEHIVEHNWNTNKNDKNIKEGKEDIFPLEKSELVVVDYIRKFVEIKSMEFHQIKSQIEKRGLDTYLVDQEKVRQGLLKKGYEDNQIKLALEASLADEFRKKNILSVKKLTEKNKDGSLYIDVMLDVAKALLAKKQQNAMR